VGNKQLKATCPLYQLLKYYTLKYATLKKNVFQGVEFIGSPSQAALPNSEGQSSQVSNKQLGAISFFYLLLKYSTIV
jgi:hypothetical protein